MNDDGNKRKLYNTLSKDYDMGSYEQFSQDVEDEGKRRKLYDAIKGDYDLPDFNGFSRQLAGGRRQAPAPAQSPVPTTQRQQQPQRRQQRSKAGRQQRSKARKMSPAQIAYFNASVARMRNSVAQTMERSKNISAYVKQRMFGGGVPAFGLGVGKKDRPTVFSSNNVVAGDIEYNPKTGKIEQTYLTQAGNKHTSRFSADMEQRRIDEEKERRLHPVESQLKAAEAEKERLAGLMRKRMEEIDARKTGHPVAGLIRDLADESHGMPGGIVSDNGMRDYRSDRRYRQLEAAARKNRQTIRTLRDKRDGLMNDFWHTLGDTLTNGYTFSDGQSDANDALSVMEAQRHVDAINRKRQTGEQLTKDEESAEAVLSNFATDEMVQGMYGKDYGAWARAATTTGTSLDFMKDILLTGGGAGALTKGIYKGVVKGGMKALAGKGVETGLKAAIGKGLLKATGVALGTTAAGAMITNTTGINRTAGEAGRLMAGHVGVNENGGYTIEGQKGMLEAIAEAERDMIGENQSEMFGEFIPGGGKLVRKGLEKIGLSRVSNALTSIGNKEWYRRYSKLLEAGGWNGLPGEGIEEYEGLLFDALTGHGSEALEQVQDPRTHIDIWLGCATMGAFLGFAPAVAQAGSTAQYYRYKHQANKSGASAASVIGDRWNEIQEQIDGTPNGGMADVLTQMVLDPSLNHEQKNAVLDYARNLTKMRGYNLATANNAGEEKDPDAEAANNAYGEGYNATEDTDMQDVKNRYEMLGEEAGSMLGEDMMRDLDADPVGMLRTIRGFASLSDGQKQMAVDYVNAKSAYDGLIQRVRDDIDSEIAQSDAMVDSRVAREEQGGDGMIHPATLKEQDADGHDKQVFVVSGNVRMMDDGSMIDTGNSDETIIVRDAETGKLQFMSPGGLLSLGDVIDAEQLKEETRQQIRERKAREAADKTDGTLAFAIGDTYQFPDEAGGQHTYAIMQDLGDGMVAVALDGNQQMPVSMSKQELQAMADARNRSRVTNLISRQGQQTQAEVHNSRQPQYNLNEEITLQAGSEDVRAIVTSEENEDGLIEVESDQPINGRKVNMFSREQLDGMLSVPQIDEERAVLDGVSNVGDGLRDAMSGQSAAADEQAGAEPMPMIDVKGRMKPDWSKATPQRAHAYLYNERGLSRENADAFVENNRKSAESELAKLRKKRPKMGTDLDEFEEKTAGWQGKMDDLQRQHDYWKAVQHEQFKTDSAEQARISEKHARRMEEAKRRRAEEERLREEAERKEREAINGVPDMVDDTPQDARARGYRRLNGYKVDRQEPLQALQGKAVSVKFSNDVIPQGNVAVIDARQLQPSHAGGQRNPLHFIDEAQPKERIDDASRYASSKIAGNIRPEEITSSVTAYTGAPTINARGEVIQGNNRSDALRQMWQSYPEEAARYKQYLIGHAADFGLRAEDIEAMQSPVLVNMLDVEDAEAITLGQFVAQDTESGGTERIKAKNAVQKMGNDMRTFANLLLKSADEEATFAQLLDDNGTDVLKWMSQKGYITPTQYKSAFDGRGNVSGEAKNDLRSIMYQSVFRDGGTRLEEMFNAMPVKAQKAILATAYRDYDSPIAERMVVEIQNSIRAFNAMSQDEAFKKATNFKDAREAAEMWKRSYQFDDATGESYLPSENFSNFALLLATLYKGANQTTIQGTFNKLYDLIQGTQETSLFEQPDNTPRTLAQAIRETLNIEYNGQRRSNVLAGDSPAIQGGQQGSNGNAETGERAAPGEEPADGGGGTGSNSEEVNTPQIAPSGQLKTAGLRDVTNPDNAGIGTNAAKTKAQDKGGGVDRQGNPLNSDGTLYIEEVASIDDITDADFEEPTRTIALPDIPNNVRDAIGAGEKPVIIKKNIFERNGISHSDLTPEQSRDILRSALYNADLYGQNQKNTKPYNWVVINITDEAGKNKLVLLEVNQNNNNVEIVHWHYLDARGLEKLRRQADREDGQLLILPSIKEEVGALSDPTDELSSAGKDNTLESDLQGKAGKSVENNGVEPFSSNMESASADVNTSPTDAQKEAGNYRKGHLKFDGYDISIENPKGSVRRGTDADGNEWEQEMQNTYGYIRGTEGVDGDHIDVFLSDDPTSGDVFVVDQVNKDGSFDEHKVMYGFPDIESARKAYLSNYEEGWQGLGAITPVSKEEFKKWIESSHRKTKPFAEYSGVKPLGDTLLGEKVVAEPQESAQAYTIEPAEYTNKKGKTEHQVDMARSYQLSDEVDGNGRRFVLNSEGSVEFGEIGTDTGLTPAPILLSEGIITNPGTNDGYGLVHIEARHGEQIRNAGYNSVVEFIEEVARNYEVIREGKKRYGNHTYMLQLTDKHNNTLMVELSGDGAYWNVNTAGIFKTSYGAKRDVVYNRHTTAKQSAETAEASLSGEQSGTTPSTRMKAPTQTSVDVSVGKDNTLEGDLQGKAGKSVENSIEKMPASLSKAIDDFAQAGKHRTEGDEDNDADGWPAYKKAKRRLLTVLDGMGLDVLHRLQADSGAGLAVQDVLRRYLKEREAQERLSRSFHIHLNAQNENRPILAVESKERAVRPYDFVEVGKDARLSLSGTYHDGGYVIGMDGHVLFARKENYPQSVEGKVTDGKGNIVDDKYPDWKKLFNDDFIPAGVEARQLRLFANGVESYAKEEGMNRKDVSRLMVSFMDAGNKVRIYSLRNLQKFLRAAKDIGSSELLETDNGVLCAKSENGSALCTPLFMDDFNDYVFAYSPVTVDASVKFDERPGSGMVAEQIAGQISVMPSNVVPPHVREALEERGVRFVQTDNKGRIQEESPHAGKTWASVYGKKRKRGSLQREGSDSTTSQQVSNPADGRSRAAFARRQWRRAHDLANDWIEKLGIGEITSVYERIGDVPGNERFSKRRLRSKGWYDPETGRIAIVMNNHHSPQDVLQTILHEAVAHYGLRKLFGKNFDNFLDNVYDGADILIKERIAAKQAVLVSKGKNAKRTAAEWRRVATEEYLAGLAETTDFENAVRHPWAMHWFNRIKSWFLDMLHSIGLKNFGGQSLYDTVSDNELRYILWRSYKNLTAPGAYRNYFNVAEDIAMQNSLGAGNYAKANAVSQQEAEPRPAKVAERNIGSTSPGMVRERGFEDDVRFVEDYENDVESINGTFNEQLQQQINGTLPKGHIYDLGMPSDILLSTGFPNVPIELSATHLSDKASVAHHPFGIDEMKDLVKAIQKPMAVFAYGDKSQSQNAIVEIQHDGKNFVVGIHFNQQRHGAVINDIRGLYPKDNAEWLNWVTQDKLLYADKEKVQTLIDQQRRTLAEVGYLDLNSVAKIIKDFVNPIIVSQENENNPFRDDDFSVRDKAIVRDAYERMVTTGGYQFQEAVQDAPRANVVRESGVEDDVRFVGEGTGDRIMELFNQAIDGKLKGKPVAIGRITKEGKEYLENLSGVKMKDVVDFVLNPSDMVHIYNDHFGDNEKDKGNNVPLTEDDIRNIAEIISHPDSILFGTEAKTGRNMFFFFKKNSDGTYNLAEVYGDRKGNLTAKSFYNTKKEASQRVMEIKRSLLPTSVTYSGATPSSGAKIPTFFETTSVDGEEIAEPIKSDAFKQFFGDWENAPEEASKMVDETGKPKVFYHSTPNEFTVFDATRNGTHNDAGWLGDGFYFYGVEHEGDGYGKNKMAVYLNIRNPYYATSEDMERLAEANSREASIAFRQQLEEAGYDGVYYNGDLREEAVAFYPNQIKSAPDNVGTYDAGNDDIRYRDSDDATPRALARDAYERLVLKGTEQFVEAVQDSMLSLKNLYLSIIKAEGTKGHIEDVAGYENAYLAENRMHSMSQGQIDAWEHDFMQPLVKIVNKITGGDKAAYSELIDYMMAKHGLERNQVLAERDFKKYQQEYPQGTKTIDDFREKDYSGLTALTGEDDVQVAEDIARQMASDFEREHDLEITELWDRVNAATKSSLEKAYMSGIMSRERYEQIRDMFEYYIPLQGFDEAVAEDVYAYVGSDGTRMYGTPIRTAKGRKSKADDPLATIEMNGEAAIRQGNRNIMKQRFLNFVQNHPSDLVSVSDVWLRHNDVTDEWEQYFDADLKEDDTPDEVERKTREFEERMEQLAESDPGHYKRGGDLPGVPYRVLDRNNAKQHQVLVRRNGNTFVLTINGNPRAAQALNGLTNPDVFTEGFFGKAMNWGQAFNRQLSALYTTRNPEFVISNFIRDAIYSNSMVWVKEGPNYALRFHKNFGKVNPAFMVKMFAEWESGELRMKVSAMPTGTLSHKGYMRKRFYEFLMNGGETGWTNLRDIEKHKRDLERAIKREGSTSRKVWKALGGMFDLGNRSVENCARFAAYLTSREMGRSLERAIWDAKEISVNFNKKGAGDKFLNAKGQTKMGKVGAAIGGAGRGLYVFWNASLQGLNNIARATGRHPFKAAGGLMTSLYAMGVVMPLLSALVGGDDDDDKDSYYNLPEYIRRSNICFRWSKDMPWITIPLPIEFRAIYGLGELTTGVVTGKERYSDEELAKQFTSQISQVLPLDFMEGSGGWHAFVPSQIKPFVEAATNKGWTGLPIYRENKFKPYAPQWTRAYDSANKQLVEATKWLNEKTGGDDVTQGFIDWNPAKIEYMLKGYLGGVFTMYDRLQKTTETVFGQRDFDWRNIPVASRVLKQGDERTAARKARSEYSDLLHEYENTRERLRGYEKIVDSKREDYMEYAERIDFLHHSKEYTHYQILDYYKPLFDAYYKLEKDADGADKRQIQQEEDVLRREFVDLIHAVDDGKDVDVDAHIINMMNDMLKSDREEVSKAAGRAYKRHDKNGKIEKPEQPNR